MFTGIVELIGTVQEYNEFDESSSGGQGVSVVIKDAAPILKDCHIGDSIAINGICLTVTEFDVEAGTFKVGISLETIKRTNVSSWKPNSKVNLERAVSQDVRFGGHYVQGHVDTVASIVGIEPEGNAVNYSFQLNQTNDDKKYMNYIVEKGFICIDGTSLTVVSVDDNNAIFSISMIKHTQENVIMPLKGLGDLVNIEVDLTGKIIEKQILMAVENQIEKEDSLLSKMITKIVDKRIQKYLK
ncbi:riboflavin synthase NDAI_0E03500 [Naumovozyma dairenensis CBS 421]|uniref:Riboflavin synthase n=1 Tax=Naumovozyma dairenensis (strain ATCC 10597 / BCRC 20456 / CBS 421 / NBRC 0211 / NRRL Y-12639) TaxID=1071378 RepID=G0WBP7_NAUDC|nr:hypothetical protein NDAI_0E03500 [Naumovozyma dairenensis CBS 421]CCD25167.1 hypothetical protein NDAI_0E03500 [Naumovozyma dairenensis CBS 421]